VRVVINSPDIYGPDITHVVLGVADYDFLV